VLERAVSAAPGLARRELWRSCVAFVILPVGVGPVKLPRRSGSLIARRAATLAGGSEPAAVLGAGLGPPVACRETASGGPAVPWAPWRRRRCPEPGDKLSDAVSVDEPVDYLCKMAVILCTCRKKLGIATRPVSYGTSAS